MYNYREENKLRQLFEKYNAPNKQEKNDALVDYFGVTVPIQCAPSIASRAGQVLSNPPIPSDTFRATAVEYQAVAESVDAASDGKYVFIEAGASYAPFCAVAAKMALKAGLAEIFLRPIEAAARGVEKIHLNFSENGYTSDGRLNIHVLNAAIAASHGVAYFPDVDCTVDNGGGVSSDSKTDNRGVSMPMIEVKTIPFSDVINTLPENARQIDLLHLDIQGAEVDFVHAAMDLLDKHCKRILIGTHSRKIEGELIEFFLEKNWLLLAEEPCEMRYMPNRTILGMTVRDGNLYFLNQTLSPLKKKVRSGQGHLDVNKLPNQILVNEQFQLGVKLFNDSNQDWHMLDQHPLCLAYHWQTPTGENVVFDGRRTALPGVKLAAGAQVEMSMLIDAPALPGRYRLILLPVQELSAWFDALGFTPLMLELEVVALKSV